MSKEKKVVLDVEELYGDEINSINNKLNQLRKGEIQELHPNRGQYGSLSTNIDQLRDELNKLFSDIKYGRTTSLDEQNSIFKA